MICRPSSSANGRPKRRRNFSLIEWPSAFVDRSSLYRLVKCMKKRPVLSIYSLIYFHLLIEMICVDDRNDLFSARRRLFEAQIEAISHLESAEAINNSLLPIIAINFSKTVKCGLFRSPSTYRN